MRIKALLFPFISLFSFIYAAGQVCLPINISSSTATAASCPSGGSITIVATGTGLTYRIINGPTGYLTATNTTGIFNSLAAGNYIIEIKDACSVVSNVSKTVANAYPVFSVAATAANVCSSSVMGGTVTGTATGGKAPYHYDIVPNGSAPVFGAATAATSYNETVSSFGIYRFYSKDACGEVRTYDINVQPTQPKPSLIEYIEYRRDRPCAEVMDGLPTITWRLHFFDENGQWIDFHQLVGASWQIYKPNPANSITSVQQNSNCLVSQGALLNSGTVLAANIPPEDVTAYPVVMPMEDVILVFTSKCGYVYKCCLDFNLGAPATPDAFFGLVQQSCNASWNNQTISILSKGTAFMTEPLSFLLTKNNGQTVTNTTGTFTGLVPNNLPATIRVTDACGRQVTKSFIRPVQGAGLQFSAEPEWNQTCSNVRNTASAYIRITGGDLPGVAEANNVVITGGTATAIPRVSSFYDWVPGYMASNLLAGFTYKIVITNLCNEKDSAVFTVPNDHWTQPVLNWNLTAPVNALCGQNQGIINANAHFTGYGTVGYYLYNLAAPNTVIATNASGSFENVAPGNYKVKFVVLNINGDCPNSEVRDSVNLVVLGDGAAQTITRKTVTVCELNGSPLPSGKAIIQVSGSAPFDYEIIKTSLVGTGSTEVWTLSSVNNPSNNFTWDLPLAGDPPFTMYSFRSSDKCDNRVTTQGSLQPLAPPVLETLMSPCVGNTDYTLSIMPHGGNFTYRWVKLPDTVTTLSNLNTLTLPGAYDASMDGTYRCYVTLTGCVNRTRDVQLRSGLCGFALPLTLVSFSGKFEQHAAVLHWVTENEMSLAGFELERSYDNLLFKKITTVAPKNNAGSNSYSYIDANPGNSNMLFYRIKITDKDGKFTYSPIVRMLVAEAATNQLVVFPNPVQGPVSMIFSSNANTEASIQVTDNTGRVLLVTKTKLLKGINVITAAGSKQLQPGTYMVTLLTATAAHKARFVKIN